MKTTAFLLGLALGILGTFIVVSTALAWVMRRFGPTSVLDFSEGFEIGSQN